MTLHWVTLCRQIFSGVPCEIADNYSRFLTSAIILRFTFSLPPHLKSRKVSAWLNSSKCHSSRFATLVLWLSSIPSIVFTRIVSQFSQVRYFTRLQLLATLFWRMLFIIFITLQSDDRWAVRSTVTVYVCRVFTTKLQPRSWACCFSPPPAVIYLFCKRHS